MILLHLIHVVQVGLAVVRGQIREVGRQHLRRALQSNRATSYARTQVHMSRKQITTQKPLFIGNKSHQHTGRKQGVTSYIREDPAAIEEDEAQRTMHER